MAQNLKLLRRTRLASIISARIDSSAFRSDQSGLEVIDLQRYPLQEPGSGRRYTVIAIETRSGLSGFGEGGPVSLADLARAKRILLGKPATAYELLRQQMNSLTTLQGAVNMALLDVIGKFSRAPVYQVLGGPTRNRIRVATRLEGSSTDDLITAMKQAHNAGFRAFLIPPTQADALNQGQDFVMATRNRLAALRESGGEDVDFILDGAGLLTPGHGASLARAFEQFHLLWFDEPCPLSNLRAIRKISSETVTPLGFGRELHQSGVFLDLLREQIVDVLRPSVCLNGITPIRKMAAMAEAYYVAVAPHHVGGPVGTAAALQLAGSLPNFFIQQVPFPSSEADIRMRQELTGTPAEQVNQGFVKLPRGPGLGITVNPEALEKYKERGL